MKKLFFVGALFGVILTGVSGLHAQAQGPASVTAPAPAAATSTSTTPAANRGGRRGGRGNAGPPTLGLADGFLEFDTPDFTLKLVKDSQTVAALTAKAPEAFDFTPGNQLDFRSRDRYNYLGDLTFRARTGDAGAWQSYATSTARKPVTALEAKAPVLAAADLSPTLPDDCPLQITRTWRLEGASGSERLVLQFTLKNRTARPAARRSGNCTITARA